MHYEDKILIEIASYRDPELLNTIKSAILQADNPQRVFFAVCYQGDDDEDYNILKKIKNCKIVRLKESEVKGACYARYLCQRMLEDEKYVYQIDSHMRFVKHWDQKMIEQLFSLNDEKATISFYPPNLTKEMAAFPLNHKVFDNPGDATVIYAKGFKPGVPLLSFGSTLRNSSEQRNPIKGAFISAGNFFSFADAHREVTCDPEMFWYGDELPIAIRLYTHGWNNYYTNSSYVWHRYLREGRAVPEGHGLMGKKEEKRFLQLLGIDDAGIGMGEFGLGNKRTLKEFENFAGLDFTKRIIFSGKTKEPQNYP